MADGFIGEVPLFSGVILGGAMLMFLLVRRRDIAYPLMPGLWFAGRYVYDLGVGPLTQVLLGISPFEMFGFSSDEGMRVEALGLGLQAGVALAIGFLFIKWHPNGPMQHMRSEDRTRIPAVAHSGGTAWHVAVGAALFGAVLWLLWIQTVGGFAAAFEGMRERIFSTGLEVETPFSTYIRMGVQFLPLGALMLLGLSGNNRGRQRVAAGFVFLAIVVFFVAGGRGRIAFFLAGCLIVWHERIARISRKQLIAVGTGGAVLMVALSYLRGDSPQLSVDSVTAALIFTWANPDRVESIAWIQSIFPEIEPFTGGSSLLNSLSLVFPILDFEGAGSMWGTMTDMLFGGQRFNSGFGGWNFHGAAELYMNFGTLGVWVGFLTLGALLSLLFAYVHRRRGELFPTIVLATMLPLFSIGVGTRPNDALAGCAITLSMLGALAAAMNPRRPISQVTLFGLLICGVLFFGWKFSGSEELRWLLGGTMFLVVPMMITGTMTCRTVI